MDKIVSKATEGGYELPHYFNWKDIEFNHRGIVSQILLEKSFWKALGKSCGWNCGRVYHGKSCDEMRSCSGCGKGYGTKSLGTEKWKTVALTFHEINLTEGWEKAVEYLQQITNIK